jgi:hypothetical protein
VSPKPEIKTPHPSELGGKKGKRGERTNHKGRSAHDIAAALKGYRVVRYVAQSHARSVLKREAIWMMESGFCERKYPGDIFRTVDCMTKQHSSYVNVHRNPEFNSASYSGLVTCGSVWACPLCASKIQERRRVEIEKGMTFMAAASMQAIMVTFTFPHQVFHKLDALVAKQATAFAFLRKGSPWVRLMTSLGFGGLIRSLEVTHGGNGWHPHTHELWFVSPGCNVAQLRCDLAQRWATACKRAGLLDSDRIEDQPAFFCHSVDVRGEVDSGDYLAKQDDSRSWGMSHEIAKATSKASRLTGVHPHRFLVRQDPGDDQRYLEYVYAMKGRRQLYWSPGLKAKCGVGEVTDEDLAEQIEKGAYLLATIPATTWNYVIGNDARCEILDAAEAGGFDAICDVLRSLGVPENSMPFVPQELAA